MGNQQNQHYSVLSMPGAGQWKQLERTDHCLIIQNQETGQEAQVYTVFIRDDRDLKDQLQMYEYRKVNQTKLVSVYNVQKGNSKGFCSGTDTYRVITERIPLRLHQVENLQLPQAMYVLKQCLDGFQLIYQSIEGPIQITKQMIGFTPEGRVKIWVNPNFSANMPQRSSYIRSEAYHFDESIMPLQLLKLVEEQTSSKSFPPELMARIQQQSKNTLTFARMKAIIRSFCIDNSVPPLQRLNFQRESYLLRSNTMPTDKIMIIQQTTIQKKPPPEVLASTNVSIVQAVPVGSMGVQGFINQSVSQAPAQVVRQQRIIQDKVRPFPGGPIINSQFVHQTSSSFVPMRPQQLNYPLEFPMTYQPAAKTAPLQSLNFTHLETVSARPSYKQPIDYEYGGIINAPIPSPLNVPISSPILSSIPTSVTTTRQTVESLQKPAYYTNSTFAQNQVKLDQYNEFNNPKVPYTLSNDYSVFNNQVSLCTRPQLEYQSRPKFDYHNFSISNPSSNASSQAAAFGNAPIPSYISSRRTYEAKFQALNAPPDQSFFPIKNDPYLTIGTPSRGDSLTNFSASASIQQHGVSDYSTPLKSTYEYATTVKKQKRQIYSPVQVEGQVVEVEKPFFDDYQPQFPPREAPKHHEGGLLKKVDLLTNDIQHQINEATSQYRTETYRSQAESHGRVNSVN